MKKPDSSTLCKGKCRNATARSLIAFVQKHKLTVEYLDYANGWLIVHYGRELVQFQSLALTHNPNTIPNEIINKNIHI